MYGNYGGRNHHKHNAHKLYDVPVLKRVTDCVLETAKKSVVWCGVVGWSGKISKGQKFRAMTTPHSTSIAMPPPYNVPEGTLIVNCLIMLAHNHVAEDGCNCSFRFTPNPIKLLPPGVCNTKSMGWGAPKVFLPKGNTKWILTGCTAAATHFAPPS